MNTNCFVYLLLDGDKPFYVGCSKRNDRLNGHLQEARYNRGGKAKNEIIRHMLAKGQSLQRKIAEGLTRDQALALERETMLKFHITNGGTVINPHGLGSKKVRALKARIIELEAENWNLRQKLGLHELNKRRQTLPACPPE
jgi:hypothetical protein